MLEVIVNRLLKVMLVIILTSGLLIAGCSADSGPEDSGQAPQVGKLAPDFQFKDVDGQSVFLSDLQGNPVLINFWASWCYPCIYEMPFLQEVYEEWSGQGLVMLAINKGESLSTVNDFLQSGNFSFPVLLDINQYVALEYNAWNIPTTFFIDKDGMIQAIKVGPFLSKAEIEMMLSAIIP